MDNFSINLERIQDLLTSKALTLRSVYYEPYKEVALSHAYGTYFVVVNGIIIFEHSEFSHAWSHYWSFSN